MMFQSHLLQICCMWARVYILTIDFEFFRGLMPEVDYAILSEWYNWIQENEDMHIDLIGNLSLIILSHMSVCVCVVMFFMFPFICPQFSLTSLVCMEWNPL